MSGVSKSEVSRLCAELDKRVHAFLERPIEGDWPYLWIDATYVKTRQASRIVSVAVIVAVGVNTDGQRQVLGMKVGPSEAEPFWTEFLRSLMRRGLRGESSPKSAVNFLRSDQRRIAFSLRGQQTTLLPSPAAVRAAALVGDN
jgi:transposase-like protein